MDLLRQKYAQKSLRGKVMQGDSKEMDAIGYSMGPISSPQLRTCEARVMLEQEGRSYFGHYDDNHDERKQSDFATHAASKAKGKAQCF